MNLNELRSEINVTGILRANSLANTSLFFHLSWRRRQRRRDGAAVATAIATRAAVAAVEVVVVEEARVEVVLAALVEVEVGGWGGRG